MEATVAKALFRDKSEVTAVNHDGLRKDNK
jgi:hypothetical protein